MASVRMGEMVVSGTADDELVALGLGSCIGLALLDAASGTAGLAHVVLPDSSSGEGPAGKFADRAVPELIERMVAAGAVRRRLEAVLVGGAQMFELGSGMDIGARNDTAVRAALAQANVRIRAASTGGNVGRTIRVKVGAGIVTVKAAGEETVTLVEGSGSSGSGAPFPAAPSGLSSPPRGLAGVRA